MILWLLIVTVRIGEQSVLPRTLCGEGYVLSCAVQDNSH